MPVTPERDLGSIYTAIGEVLSDEEIEAFVRKATGNDLYVVYAARDDPRAIKIQKTIEKLRGEGNERWLLTYVLIHAAAAERLRQRYEKLSEKVVRAFPKTMIRLPRADIHVVKALECLKQILNIPLSAKLKFELRPKQNSLQEMVQRVVELSALKSLHETWLLLLLALNYDEELLANPTNPDPANIAVQLDTIVEQAPTALALLGFRATEQRVLVNQLIPFSASLRNVANTPDTTARIIDDLQRMVRLILSQLNGHIFCAVQELSFDPLMTDPPSEIEDRREFKDLIQAVRDLTVTVVARTLKQKMWQDAENQMSLVSNYFELPDDAAGIADDWFRLRYRVEWLASLEPDEPWADQANDHAMEIDTELFKEGELEDDVRTHFRAYQKWFNEPFKRVDEALMQDCGSLRKIDDPLKIILRDLSL